MKGTSLEEADNGILQPLLPCNEVGGYPAGALYAVLAVLRMSSYGLALLMYCSAEPAAGGWAGCKSHPPTLSTGSSYLGVHGGLRSSLCIMLCVTQIIIVWLTLRYVYCELLQDPPLPSLFTVALSTWCLLDFMQVATAHSTEHWVIAHIFFCSLCVAMLIFFHGALTRDGLWGHGVSVTALPGAMVFLVVVIGLCIWMLGEFQFDQNMTLADGVWVQVEYITAALVTVMQVLIGLSFPPGLVVCVRSDAPALLHVAMTGESSGQHASPKLKGTLEHLGTLEHRLRGEPAPAGRAHLRAQDVDQVQKISFSEVPRRQYTVAAGSASAHPWSQDEWPYPRRG